MCIMRSENHHKRRKYKIKEKIENRKSKSLSTKHFLGNEKKRGEKALQIYLEFSYIQPFLFNHNRSFCSERAELRNLC